MCRGRSEGNIQNKGLLQGNVTLSALQLAIITSIRGKRGPYSSHIVMHLRVCQFASWSVFLQRALNN